MPTTLPSRIKQRFRDSVFALQTFNLSRFTAMFLVSVFLVKIGIDVELIAGYEYVVFLSSIVTGWWIHGFLQSFMADSGLKEKFNVRQVFRDYSKLLLVTGSGILLVISAAIEILANTGFIQRPPEGFYYFLIFHMILQVSIFIAYFLHRIRKVTGIYILAGYLLITYVGSFLWLFLAEIDLRMVYFGLAVLSIPILFLWAFLYGRPLKPSLAIVYAPHLTTLMVIQGIGFLSLWSDGFWVQYFYGTGDLFAFFRYGGREFPLFVILTTTFSTAIIHRVQAQNQLIQIRNTSRRYIMLFLPVAIFLMSTSSYLFGLVFDQTFVPASFIFDLYLLLVLIRVLFPRPILIAYRNFQPLLWISVGELFLNLILSYLLFWIWGIAGLIMASLIAHAFELGASIVVVYRKTGISPFEYIPIPQYAILTLALFSLLWIKYGWFQPDWLPSIWQP